MRTKSSITELIVALLVFLFLYTALSKLLDFYTFRFSLRGSPILKYFAGTVAIGLPILEIVLVVLLTLPKTRLLGLYSAAILLTLFTVYLTAMVLFVKELPCGCGGVISKLGWKSHIFFNLFFIVISVIGIRLQKQLRNADMNEMQATA